MPKVVTAVDLPAVLGGLAAISDLTDKDRQVLDAVVDIVQRSGLAAVEFEAVAEAAGTSRSSIYRRFGDRNSLIAATIAHASRRFLTELSARVSDIDDPEDRVVAAFCHGLRLLDDGRLGAMVRQEPLLLRLLTVDAGPLITASARQLSGPGGPSTGTAEMLIRLAISLLLTPDSVLQSNGRVDEGAVRRHVGPLVRVTLPR